MQPQISSSTILVYMLLNGKGSQSTGGGLYGTVLLPFFLAG